jgi:phosphate transport system substrate-binding protein
MIFKRLLFSLCLFTIFLFGCKGEEDSEQLETATAGTFEFIADEELRPVLDSLIQGFMLENPRTKVTIKYASAGEAIEALLTERSRLAIVARFLTPLEQDLLKQNGLTLPEYEVAQNAVACIVSENSPLNVLSMKDLRALIRNEAKNWVDFSHSEFLGSKPPGFITKVLPPFYSGTEHLLDSIFLEPKVYQQGSIRRFVTSDSIVKYVATNPHTIGFISAPWLDRLQKTGDSSVKAIPLMPDDSGMKHSDEPIMLHLAYIHQGLYPLTNRVNAYSFDSPNTLPRGLIAYITTAHGQVVFKNHGVLPRTQIIRIVPNQQ